MSVGILYHYFSSKDELFCYSVEETVEMKNKCVFEKDNNPLDSFLKPLR